MKTNGNNPAMPIHEGTVVGCAGLTKREIFAMAAMQGYCANSNMTCESEVRIPNYAVKQADALIEALNKEITGTIHDKKD